MKILGSADGFRYLTDGEPVKILVEKELKVRAKKKGKIEN